jgi:hypothetical protein
MVIGPLYRRGGARRVADEDVRVNRYEHIDIHTSEMSSYARR